jgi:DNA-binding beta-propeller fold protein YncE
MFGSSRVRVVSALCACLIAAAFVLQAGAEDPANPFFRAVWERTDKPVSDGLVSRTWQWGPQANTLALREPYAEAPGGQREVQYYDKSRMEITQPTTGDPNSIWFVTNGLLVVELMSGKLQLGDAAFEQHLAALVNVAGDADDTAGPTYAALESLRSAAPAPDGSVITQTVDRNGAVGQDAQFSSYNVTAAERVTAPGIDHQIASPFWTFMNASGPVYENGNVSETLLFQNPYFATGLPVTEAYWARIKVAGTLKPVLLQCFERRCLTYTPDNPPGWQVEQGNVGQHYYAWRYADGGGEPTATATEPDPSPSASEPPVTDYSYTSSFGLPSDPGRKLQIPIDIAFDSGDNLYVVDLAAHRVQKFDPLGQFLTQWGSNGTGDGLFDLPYAVVADASGYVYVVDKRNHRIQKFDQNGQFLLKWGIEGTLAGQFKFPGGIAVDAAGNVYVADSGNDRIQKFDSLGVPLSQWGTSGAADGQFKTPGAIVVDAEGLVYVCDEGNNRVQVFGANSAYLRKWGTPGTANGQFDLPLGIVLSADETRVYVADADNSRVQVFDPLGVFLTSIGTLGASAGQLNSPTGIAFSGSERLYVADAGNARVQIFDVSNGASIGLLYSDSRGRFGAPLGIEVTSTGVIIVADPALNQVKLFADTGGEFFGEWGDLELSTPSDVAIDSAGILYVTDSGHNRVVKYNLQGQKVGEWGTTGTGNGQFNSPLGIAIDAGGNVYVVDQLNHRVQKFTAAGAFLTSWGGMGNGPGQFGEPGGIAIRGNSVYITEWTNNRVQEFDLNGAYIRQWGSAGSGEGQFLVPGAIAVDAQGYLYVTDVGNNRVQEFTSTGEFLLAFGMDESVDTQLYGMPTTDTWLNEPIGIAIGLNGNLLVSDEGNKRVAVFGTPQ